MIGVRRGGTTSVKTAERIAIQSLCKYIDAVAREWKQGLEHDNSLYELARQVEEYVSQIEQICREGDETRDSRD